MEASDTEECVGHMIKVYHSEANNKVAATLTAGAAEQANMSSEFWHVLRIASVCHTWYAKESYPRY